jgi:hypothetical protein
MVWNTTFQVYPMFTQMALSPVDKLYV